MGKNDSNDIFINIHSGSRNFGLKVCKHHTNEAKKQKNFSLDEFNKKRDEIVATSEKKDIQSKIKALKDSMNMGVEQAYLRGEAMFNYCVDMIIAQYYAELNRKTMLDLICKNTGLVVTEEYETIHNYIDFTHFIVRKGAISAQKGEKCAIPMNMRDGVLLCVGKGNEDWNCSAPHGAGRIMSRSEAKRQLSMEDFTSSMDGIFSTSVNEYTIDESPMAYKDANMIMEAILPTVDILEVIKPILNLKSNE